MDIPWSTVGVVAAYVLLVVTTVGGLIGSFIPAFPGAILIWGGAVVHGLATGWEPLGLVPQLSLAALCALAIGGQLAISAAGAKRFGSTNWGVLGAGVGMLVGTFVIPIPVVGSLLGAFAGALGFELLRQRRALKKEPPPPDAPARNREELGRASKAGLGAALGAVAGMMAEIGLSFVMAGVVLAAVLF